MEDSNADADHWLNGFLQQNCEEARKRVQEERNLWNLTDENEDLDLSGIFNFTDYEEFNGQGGEEILPSKTFDSDDLSQMKPASFDDGTSIHDTERRTEHDGIRQNLNSSPLAQRSVSSNDDISIYDERRTVLDDIQNHKEIEVTTLHEARQSLNSSPMACTSTSSNDGISSDGDDQRAAHDAGHTSSADHVTSKSTEADWDFETDLVEVASMDIVHAKQQLQRAINDFNSNVVDRERAGFRLTMKQIEATVNEVLEEVERLDNNFKLRRMSPDSYYEVKSWNEIDLLIALENVSLNEVVIEDMKTPTGYARIRVMSQEVTSLSNVPSSEMTSALNMTSSHHQLFQWCTETQSGELYLSPKKLCKEFAALVSRAAGRILRNGSSVNRKRVTFSDTEASVPFTVNLIPTVECPQTWPLCAYWLRNYTKKWPAVGVKDDVIRGGMHLVALVTSKESDPLWRINFCAARRHLLRSDCEGKKKCLRILKVLLDKDLSRPKGLLPLYLENIVLWASRKHWQEEEWAECMLPERFLEMLMALHKCLENKDCYNFFVPTMNLFSNLRPEVVQMLAAKVKDVLHDPFKYLKS